MPFLLFTPTGFDSPLWLSRSNCTLVRSSIGCLLMAFIALCLNASNRSLAAPIVSPLDCLKSSHGLRSGGNKAINMAYSSRLCRTFDRSVCVQFDLHILPLRYRNRPSALESINEQCSPSCVFSKSFTTKPSESFLCVHMCVAYDSRSSFTPSLNQVELRSA